LNDPATETGAQDLEGQCHLDSAREKLLTKRIICKKGINLEDLKKNKEKHMELLKRNERRASA